MTTANTIHEVVTKSERASRRPSLAVMPTPSFYSQGMRVQRRIRDFVLAASGLCLGQKPACLSITCFVVSSSAVCRFQRTKGEESRSIAVRAIARVSSSSNISDRNHRTSCNRARFLKNFTNSEQTANECNRRPIRKGVHRLALGGTTIGSHINAAPGFGAPRPKLRNLRICLHPAQRRRPGFVSLGVFS
jgi:hypothetical protein